jgi:hypothetical protein
MMARAPKKAKRRSKKRPSATDKLRPDEAAELLRALLARHPELAKEAGSMAEEMVTRVSAQDVADAVEEAILALDIDALGDRAGEHSDGYTEPTEAAWQLLQEAIDPFVDDLRRRIALGAGHAAVTTCRGIVVGLYRVRGKNRDAVLGWAEDFPAEAAAQTVAILRAAGRGSRRWSLPDDAQDEVPDWATSLARWERQR